MNFFICQFFSHNNHQHVARNRTPHAQPLSTHSPSQSEANTRGFVLSNNTQLRGQTDPSLAQQQPPTTCPKGTTPANFVLIDFFCATTTPLQRKPPHLHRDAPRLIAAITHIEIMCPPQPPSCVGPFVHTTTTLSHSRQGGLQPTSAPTGEISCGAMIILIRVSSSHRL